jgi:hypothetical protein
MKQIAIILGLVASVFMFAGCASKCCDQAAPASAEVAHHDYKGEASKK